MMVRLASVALSIGAGVAVASTPNWRDVIVATNENVVQYPGYLDALPDHLWRARGVDRLGQGRGADVVKNLRIATYGDKPSQALPGALLEEGFDVPRDRPQAVSGSVDTCRTRQGDQGWWPDLRQVRGCRRQASTESRVASGNA